MNTIVDLAAISLIAASIVSTAPTASAQDDFKRENGRTRQAQTALEGKAPPPLRVADWVGAGQLSAKGAPTLAALKGKVVLLKFWGVW